MKDQIKITSKGTVYIIDDKEVGEQEYRARYPLPEMGTADPPSGDPWRHHYSDALAVHPKQIDKAENEAREKGVPTEFERESGRPHFTSADHQRRYMKAFGFYNRAAYY